MKKLSLKVKLGYLLVPVLMLILHSCSILVLWMDYYPKSDGSKTKVTSQSYQYVWATDSLQIEAWAIPRLETHAISFGPPLLPVIPLAVQKLWVKWDHRIRLDFTFDIQQPFSLCTDSICVTDRKGRVISQVQVERVFKDRRYHDSLVVLSSPDVTFSGHVQLRFTLSKKAARVKYFDVRFSSLVINGQVVELPVMRFQRKKTYTYVPLIIGG